MVFNAQVASSSHRPASSTEGWLAPTPQVYVRHAISTLGVSNRTTGYWPHTLLVGTQLLSYTNTCFLDYFVIYKLIKYVSFLPSTD